MAGHQENECKCPGQRSDTSASWRKDLQWCVGSLSHISFLRVFTWKLRAGTWNKQKALKRKIILKNSPLGFILFFGECNPGPLLDGSHIFEINLNGPFFFHFNNFNPGCACHGPFAASSTLLCTGLMKRITLRSKRNRNNNFLPTRMRSFYSGLRFGLVVVLVESQHQKFTTSFHPWGPEDRCIFRSRWRYKRISDLKYLGISGPPHFS